MGRKSKADKRRALWLNYQLALREISLEDLAGAAGVTSRMVRYVIRGERRSLRVQKVIAQALGMKIEKIWKEE